MAGIMPSGLAPPGAAHPHSACHDRPQRSLPLPFPPRAGSPSAACVGLIVLGLAWELWLAPLRPGGSWLALKVLPLVRPAGRACCKNRMYTYRWVSLMVWLYFTEGVVRAWSDTNGVGQVLALVEVLLCLALFAACAWHVRLRLRHARRHREPGRSRAMSALIDQLRAIVGAPMC